MSRDAPASIEETPREHITRRAAARHLLRQRQLRGSFALATQPSFRNATLAGLQAAVTAAIALPAFQLSPWSHLIGFAALGVLVALFGRFAPPRRRLTILFYCALTQVLAVFIMSGVAWLGAPKAVQLTLLALSCGILLFISVSGKFGAPGPLIFVFAVGASMTSSITLSQVLERTAAVSVVSLLAWIICAASEWVRDHPAAEHQPAAEPMAPLNKRLIAAGRSAAGAGVAVLVSEMSGANFPAWAAMGALAVMQGAHLHITMNRALQRMAGTIIGALLAWMLLMQTPSAWTIIAALVVLQLVTEMIIGANYALGQIFVTPMALLMTYLGAEHPVGPEMAPERVLETLLGVAIGTVLAVLLSTLDDRHHLAEMNRAKPKSRV